MPANTTTLTPHLVVDGAAEAIVFYQSAFGAEEIARTPTPDGSLIVHAELRIAGNQLFIADRFSEAHDPKRLGGSPVTLHLQVPDVDAAFARAVTAGATPTLAPAAMLWGDRYGRVRDPFGHHWSIATGSRQPSPAEMERA